MTIKKVESSEKLAEQAFGWFLGGYFLLLAGLLLGVKTEEGDEE